MRTDANPQKLTLVASNNPQRNAYADDEAVERKTRLAMADGISVFHLLMLETSEHAHVQALLNIMAPPFGANVLDLGSGVGGVAQIMQELRTDLEFTLVNVSQAQLKLSPADFAKVCASFEDIPISSSSHDVAMFNFSIGHGSPAAAISEAARALRPGGVLFIYDLDGVQEDFYGDYLVYGEQKLTELARVHGFKRTTTHKRICASGAYPIALRFQLNTMN